MWVNKPRGGGLGPFPAEEDQVTGQFWGWTPWEAPDSDSPDVVNGDFVVEFLARERESTTTPSSSPTGFGARTRRSPLRSASSTCTTLLRLTGLPTRKTILMTFRRWDGT